MADDCLNIFKERIRELRGEESQESFGKKINVSQSTISTWSTGKTPDAGTLIMIAKKYNISLDWLFGLSDMKSLRQKPVETTSTYGDMIELVETMYECGIVEANYQPEAGPHHEGELTMNDMYDQQSKAWDIEYRKPDVLYLRDTFLRCLLIQLYYTKRQMSKEDYTQKKAYILKHFGNTKLLNFDISHEPRQTQKETLIKYKDYKKVNLIELWHALEKLNENPPSSNADYDKYRKPIKFSYSSESE